MTEFELRVLLLVSGVFQAYFSLIGRSTSVLPWRASYRRLGTTGRGGKNRSKDPAYFDVTRTMCLTWDGPSNRRSTSRCNSGTRTYHRTRQFLKRVGRDNNNGLPRFTRQMFHFSNGAYLSFVVREGLLRTCPTSRSTGVFSALLGAIRLVRRLTICRTRVTYVWQRVRVARMIRRAMGDLHHRFLRGPFPFTKLTSTVGRIHLLLFLRFRGK